MPAPEVVVDDDANVVVGESRECGGGVVEVAVVCAAINDGSLDPVDQDRDEKDDEE